MYENLDNLIDFNLKLLFDTNTHKMTNYRFVDENRKTLNDSLGFSKLMEERGLITIPANGDICRITAEGFEISKNGGWLAFLETRKNQLEAEKANQEEIERLKLDKLKNEVILSKRQRITFWWIFWIGMFGGAYSLFDLIIRFNSKEIPKEIVVTKDSLNLEMSKLRALILERHDLDTLKK